MNEFEDRYLELALEEELGGLRPPDVAARVQLRSRAPNVAASARRWRAAVLAAATLLCAFAIWFANSRGAGEVAPQLAVTVVRGAVVWIAPNGERTQLEAGRPTQFTAQRGQRLRAAAPRLTHVRFRGFGALDMEDNSEVEIESMEWNRFGSGFVAGALVVGVTAGVVIYTGGGTTTTATAGQSIEMRPVAEGDTLAAAVEKNARLEEQLRAANEEMERLRVAASRVAVAPPVAPAESPTEVAETADAPADHETPYGYGDLGSTLDAIDFDGCGALLAKLGPAIGELVAGLTEEGAEVPLEAIGEVQKVNGEIVQKVVILAKGEIPGSGINGAYTHPAVAANLVHATLAQGGLPLDEGQQRAMQDLTTRYSNEDLQRRAAYGDDTPAVQELLEETELRDRFFRDSKGLLSAEQRALVMAPEGARDRLGVDLFSSGLVWAQFAKPMRVQSRADLASAVGNQLDRSLKLSGENAAAARKVIDAWAERLPAEFWDWEADALTRRGMTPVARVREAAAHQLELYRRLQREVGLTPEQWRVLAKARSIMVPMR